MSCTRALRSVNIKWLAASLGKLHIWRKSIRASHTLLQCFTMSLKYRYVIGVYKIKIKLQFVALGGAASCAKWRPHPSESKLHTPYYASASLPRSPLPKFSQMKSQNNQHSDFPILISFLQNIAHLAPVRTVQQAAFHRTKYVHYFYYELSARSWLELYQIITHKRLFGPTL